MRYHAPFAVAAALALQACATSPAPAPSSQAMCEPGLDTAHAGVSSYTNAALTTQRIRFNSDIGVLQKPDCPGEERPLRPAD